MAYTNVKVTQGGCLKFVGDSAELFDDTLCFILIGWFGLVNTNPNVSGEHTYTAKKMCVMCVHYGLFLRAHN